MGFDKNKAYPVPFTLVNAGSGAVLTGAGATVTAKRCRDGLAQEDADGQVSEVGSGHYVLQAQAADFNADYTVGFLLTASGAVPAHVLVQMQRFRKNGSYPVPFLLVNTSDGTARTGVSPAGKRILDGAAQADVAGTFTERGAGQYVFNAAAADLDADKTAGFLLTAAGCLPVHLTVEMEKAAPYSGTTFKEKLYDLLAADAQIDDPSYLGGMLGQTDDERYGVYFRNPPQGMLPVLTYFVSSMAGRFPRDIYVSITAWGDTYEQVLDRCYDLLDGTALATSDYQVLMLRWDHAMSEQFAADLRTYYRQDRYLARVIRK